MRERNTGTKIRSGFGFVKPGSPEAYNIRLFKNIKPVDPHNLPQEPGERGKKFHGLPDSSKYIP